MLLFLFLPAGSVLIGAFKGQTSGYTLENIRTLFEHPYIDAYWESFKLSLATAVIGGFVGAFIAYAALRDGTPRWIAATLMTFSGVAANFGGIPLAFAFIASLGPLGVVTVLLQNQLHYDITAHGFSLFSVTGIGLA